MAEPFAEKTQAFLTDDPEKYPRLDFQKLTEETPADKTGATPKNGCD